MANDYNPRPHSLGSRVCAWFKANPDEKLSSRDVADKFDSAPLRVSAQLGAAEDADLLTSERVDGMNVYSAGPKLASWTPPPSDVAQPATGFKAFLARTGQASAEGRPAAPALPSPEALVIEDGVPIPPARSSLAAYEARFAEMQVGQSIPLATPAAKRLITTAQRFGKTCGRKFITRVLPADPNTSRIWRTE